MYKKILVPLDGSSHAEKILPHALEMARRYQAQLLLVQVIDAEIANLTAFDYLPEVKVGELHQQVIDARAYLQSQQLLLQKQGITSEIYIKPGGVIKGILEVASDEAVDLIAMSTHGRTGLTQLLYGSVAAGVLQGSNCPLLLVRS